MLSRHFADVLESFNQKPATKSAPVASSSRHVSKSLSLSQQSGEGDDDEDFEASLVQGMESLLKQLAGDHPPGVMRDESAASPESKPSQKLDKSLDSSKIARVEDGDVPGPTGAGGSLSAEEEEKAWQRAIEMMLSGEGLEALGLDANGEPKPGPSTTKRNAPQPPLRGSSGLAGPGGTADFDETIRRTMEQLKSAGSATSPAGGKSPTDDASLAALLAQLGSDPSALDGLGEGDDELGGLLDGMMAQLMTREVLEEPMAELASKVSRSQSSLSSEPCQTE